nr:energy transducer TonB [uncultured Flavobacterium sp.]
MKKILLLSILFVACFGFAQKKAPSTNSKTTLQQYNNKSSEYAIPEDTGIYNSAGLQVQPEYPGGIASFLTYIQKNIDYNNIDHEQDNTTTLRIYIQFIIEKDGDLTNIKMLRDPGYGAGREAERVINSNKTKWSPGIQNGKPVRASYNLPIIINLTKSNKDILPELKIKKRENQDVFTPKQLDKVPEYPGGLSMYYEYINSNFKYDNLSKEYKKVNKALKVNVSFIIEKDGSLKYVNILNDPGYLVSDEIKRILLTNEVRWSPGEKNQKIVRTEFTLPISIGE